MSIVTTQMRNDISAFSIVFETFLRRNSVSFKCTRNERSESVYFIVGSLKFRFAAHAESNRTAPNDFEVHPLKDCHN